LSPEILKPVVLFPFQLRNQHFELGLLSVDLLLNHVDSVS
jgi:hypothetical protein